MFIKQLSMILVMLFLVSLIENWISKISSKIVNLSKAFPSNFVWAHGKYFTNLDVAAPAHPSCGLAYSTIILIKIHFISPNIYFELRANAMRPDAKYHDEPCRISFQRQKKCTICPQTTRWMCWGCNIEIGEVFPVCSLQTGKNCFH